MHEMIIDKQSREPFRLLLAQIMSLAPSNQALKAMAEKSPDRWAQLLTQVARLGGYTDQLKVEQSLDVKMASMSDAQVLAELQALGLVAGNQVPLALADPTYPQTIDQAPEQST